MRFVLDLDKARDFYVGKLGLVVDLDKVEDGHHWFVAHAPAQPQVPIMLAVPGPPARAPEAARARA